MATRTLSNTALDIPAWQALLAQAREPLPRDWLRWCMDDLELGWLAPARVAPVLAVLAGCTVQGRRLVWHAQDLTPGERSLAMRGAALRLHELGLIKGWRGEAFACERPVVEPERQRGEPLFEMERAAFRFFGLQSRAAHVNGFTPDGWLWCGRRAPTKATDPGLLDNLAAGGLPAGEALRLCAQRELGEEAGVPPELAQGLWDLGALHTRRRVPEGWHDEVLQVFNLTLPAGFVPRNQDGEVSEFLCLEAGSALARCQADEFTRDAAVVTAFGLLSGLPG
jgi:8-oxo-dGTP pyrophosphatase MutT (NUDIX family)